MNYDNEARRLILAGVPIPPTRAGDVRSLSLSGTPVADLTPLAGMTGLETLYLSGTPAEAAAFDAGEDPRGYRFRGCPTRDGWQVQAGCRWFPLARAREHWRDNPDALARVERIAAAPLPPMGEDARHPSGVKGGSGAWISRRRCRIPSSCYGA
jgi:antitoxin (DNA-binding transcriptional repressor) of toxin-antitoxin stability system